MTLENRIEALERVTPQTSEDILIVFADHKEINVHLGPDVVTFDREDMTFTDLNEELKYRFPGGNYKIITFMPPGVSN